MVATKDLGCKVGLQGRELHSPYALGRGTSVTEKVVGLRRRMRVDLGVVQKGNLGCDFCRGGARAITSAHADVHACMRIRAYVHVLVTGYVVGFFAGNRFCHSRAIICFWLDSAPVG